MKKFLSSKLSKAALIVVAVSLIAAGSASTNLFEISKNMDIFTSVYKELNSFYVDDVDPNKLMRTGIDAMLESLDPYTNYISEAELETHRFQMTGKYGGIGAIIRTKDDYVIIVEPYEGFAAYNAGLRAGDVILEVDGKSAKNKTSDEMSNIMRGTPGTSIELLVQKPGQTESVKVNLVRQEIKIDNVPYYGMVEDGIGYIKLTQFTDLAGKNIGNALQELKTEHGDLSGLILDLRDNPGGLLREAVNISNLFVEKGEEIVSTKGKVKEWHKTFKALNSPVDTEIPLVVLTSRGSASASEIVSGVMQDLDRGVVVGQKTFGKGLVQSTRDVPFKTKLKITTAKYYIPSGRCIQAIDYSHRNEDGSVGKIPDSLKTEFETKGGRKVFDGGGIYPDVLVDPEKPGAITRSLVQNYHIFDFATDFVVKNPEIGDVRAFEISEKIYEEFKLFCQDKEYEYTTKSEKLLKDFQESATSEKYYDAIQEEIERLNKEFEKDKENDIIKYKDEISEILKIEIVSRYYFQKGKIEASFKHDDDIIKALEILNDEQEYKSILSKIERP